MFSFNENKNSIITFLGSLIFYNNNSSIIIRFFLSILYLASDYLVFQNITDTQITFEGFLQYKSCFFKQNLFHLINYSSSQGDFIIFQNTLSFESNILIDPNNGNIFLIISLEY